MSLPNVEDFRLDAVSDCIPKYLFVAEGFEERSLSVAEVLERDNQFEKIIVFRNVPARASRLEELKDLLKHLSRREIETIDFGRDDPTGCESTISETVAEVESLGAEVYIDISVFSRLLIMMILDAFRNFPGRIVVLYTEPQEYSPSREDFESWAKTGQAELGAFASAGLQGVLRTVGLSSSVMAGEPCVVIAFTSFNPHLIGGLLRSISPARFILIGSSPPRLSWRRDAAQMIHEQVIQEYSRDNELDEHGALKLESSTMDYRETIEVLADLYRKFCFTHRIVVAPTGSKLQAMGVALFKSICREVHIEYPMPAKYHAANYSSRDIRKIHQVVFDSFSGCIRSIDNEFGLNGTWP